jgi:hypothetical protein
MLADHINYEFGVLAICVVSKQNITSVTKCALSFQYAERIEKNPGNVFQSKAAGIWNV